MVSSTPRLTLDLSPETIPVLGKVSAPARITARRLALVTALGIGTAVGFSADARAQLVCGAAYQEFCALPGWDDPLEDSCVILDSPFVMVIAVANAPCLPSAAAGSP